ncbi:MAG TPA: TonB-dependent receptor [Chitinophagaceae bacterium]|nr:TonB-dependent receptor [Chitinophagaceae bacterium]
MNRISFSQDAIIRGQVRYGNEVLQGATIILGYKTTLTGHDGKFSLATTPGSYTLIITHAGYKKIEQTIIAEAGSTKNVEFNMIPNEQLDEVKLGSRSAIQRSNLSTTVPVDVFSSDKLVQTAQLGLVQALNYLAPSLNTGKQEFNEPVTLRGLAPDQLQILVNGTRRHTAAYMNNGNPKSSLGRGSVNNDLNAIPFSAIDKVEILRDGASAQYGSDAIAGVINIELKKSIGKASFQLHTGQFYKGDGEKLWLGGYKGFPLNKKNLPADKQGFLSLAADLRYQGPTTRAGEYQGTAYIPYPTSPISPADSAKIKAEDDSIIHARGIDKKEFTKHNGINKVISSGFMVNGGYPVSKRSKLSLTSMINHKRNQGPGAYRFPKTTSQVNTELFPNGFRPLYKETNLDFSILAGFETETRKRGHLKLNSSFGTNIHNIFLYNSNNASQQYTLGKNAPTDFYLGKLVYKLFLNNISYIKDFATENTKLKTCNLAVGAEWRLENYQTHAGDEASWKNYDTRKAGGSQPSVGSVSADNVVNKNRTVSAAYIDLEIEPGDRLLMDLAGRYEYYSDFGSNFAGKLAARYKFSSTFSLRGAISNGFRAPSIQQRFFEGTQSFSGTAQIRGIFSNVSPVTKAFNIPSLEAERSINLSGGFVSKLTSNISLTVDAYWIQIKNRVVLSGVFDRANPDIAAILGNYPDIDFVQFYVNAINTRTRGIDAVLNGRWKINKTRLELTIAAGINRNSIFGPIKTSAPVSDTSRYTNTLFGIEEIITLENDQPRKKIIFSGTISKGRFGFVFRNTLFGNTATATRVTNPTDTIYQFFSSKILSDISINYTPKSWLTITAGANNIFDVYPDRIQNPRNQGGTLYSAGATPFGSNGGYYFLNLSFSIPSKNKKSLS